MNARRTWFARGGTRGRRGERPENGGLRAGDALGRRGERPENAFYARVAREQARKIAAWRRGDG